MRLGLSVMQFSLALSARYGVADFQAGLYTFLTGNSNITDEVSTRIYPMLAPATAALPYITYQRIGQQEEAHMTGMSGLTQAPYQFDIWGSTASEAEDALLAVAEELDGYRGLMGTVRVYRLLITGILDGLEAPTSGRTLGIWRHTITADVWFLN
jgi:hypothetical protein